MSDQKAQVTFNFDGRIETIYLTTEEHEVMNRAAEDYAVQKKSEQDERNARYSEFFGVAERNSTAHSELVKTASGGWTVRLIKTVNHSVIATSPSLVHLLALFQRSAISRRNDPPQLATFLLLLIPKKDRDGLLGDLEEEYRTVVLPQFGVRRARLYYWWHTILSVGSFAVGTLRKLYQVFGLNWFTLRR